MKTKGQMECVQRICELGRGSGDKGWLSHEAQDLTENMALSLFSSIILLWRLLYAVFLNVLLFFLLLSSLWQK